MPTTSWDTLAPRATTWGAHTAPVSTSTTTDLGSPFATDTFIGTAGSLLSAHASDDGSAWSAHFVDETPARLLGNNQVTGGDALFAAAQYVLARTPPSADYAIKATMEIQAGDTGSFGIVGRSSATTETGYTLWWNGGAVPGRWEFYRSVNGVTSLITNLANDAHAPTSARSVELRMRASAIEAHIGGTLRMSMTDSNVTRAGLACIRLFRQSSGVSGRISDFRVETLESIVTTVTSIPSWGTRAPASSSWATLA